MVKSSLIRGVSKCARFFICDTTEIVKEAKNIHNLDPMATILFGKLLTVVAMLGKDLKGEKDLTTVRINGTGPYGKMLVTANKKGEVKGYINSVDMDKINELIDENGNFIRNEKGEVELIGSGVLQIIKDMGLKEPFVGLTKLEDEEISDIMASYFLNSEQIKSVVTLGVKLDENGEVLTAGGYIIQLLPSVEDSFIDKMEDKLSQIRSITELLSHGFSLERIAELLYEDITVIEDDTEAIGAHVKNYIENYEILEKSTLEYKCDCNKDRFFKGIITLGKEEINKILEEEGKIETECHFCGKKYNFTVEDFKEIEIDKKYIN